MFGNAMASLILEHRGGCEEARMTTSIAVARRLNRIQLPTRQMRMQKT